MPTDLESRVALLERSARRWRLAALALGLVVLTGAVAREDHLRARSLIIVDEQDKPVLAITGDRAQPALSAFGLDSRRRVELWVLNGGTTFDLCNGEKTAVSLSGADSHGGSLHLFTRHGRQAHLVIAPPPRD